MEKYISFSIGQLRFIDNAQFVLASLDKLVKSNDPDSLLIVREYEPDPNKVWLLFKKGIYPYEYMDDFERFEERVFLRRTRFIADSTAKELRTNNISTPETSGKSSSVKI